MISLTTRLQMKTVFHPQNAALIAWIAVACGTGSTGPIPTMTGKWSGTVAGATVSLTVNEQTAGTITGNGAISGNVSSVEVTVTGTHQHPNVSLTFRSVLLDNYFQGAFTDDKTISGRGTGSIFIDAALTLRRSS